MRTCLLLLCFYVGAVAADIDSSSKQQRKAAEQELVETRARIIKQRQALLNRYAEAQRRSGEIKKQAGAVALQRQRLEEIEQQQRLQADQESQRLRLRLERVSSALSLAAPIEQDASSCYDYWQEGLHTLFAKIEQQSRIVIQKGKVSARSGMPVDASLIQLGAVQELAVSDYQDESGLIIRNGETRIINGPLINDQAYAALQRFADQKSGVFIADIDGSLRQQQLKVETWGEWFQKGGFFIWPIVGVGLFALYLIIERCVYFHSIRVNAEDQEKVQACLAVGHFDQAASLVAEAKTPDQRIIANGIESIDGMIEEREAVLEGSLLAEESDIGRSRSMLAVLAAVAPLLGLLGTVTGMIATFQSIALYGTSNPSLMSNGISEALITTQLGLVVAVPILLAHAIIQRIADKHRMRLEQTAVQLLSLGNEVVK